MFARAARRSAAVAILACVAVFGACGKPEPPAHALPPIPMYWSDGDSAVTSSKPALPPGICAAAETLAMFHVDTVPLSALAQPPEPVMLPQPVYPQSERAQGWEGMLRVSVLVRPDGRIARGDVGDGSDPFVMAAFDALCSGQYTPGKTAEGDSVFVWISQPVHFDLGLGKLFEKGN